VSVPIVSAPRQSREKVSTPEHFFTINRAIVDAAKNDENRETGTEPVELIALANGFCDKGERLNMVNVSTFLNRFSRLKIKITGKVVKFLVTKIQESRDCESVWTIVSVIVGLSCVEQGEQGEFVKALTVKVRECAEPFEAHDLARAFGVLQSLDGNTWEVEAFIFALAIKTENCPDQFDAEDIETAMQGLRAMRFSPALRQLLAAMNRPNVLRVEAQSELLCFSKALLQCNYLT
jgi:hypothetical protein